MREVKRQPDSAPIFLHSLFRSGSTFMFDAFRRSAAYWCYYEPVHEYVIHLDTEPARLLDVHGRMAISLRHPQLNKPYFSEIYEIRSALRDLFEKNFSFDNYFSDLAGCIPPKEAVYWKTLIANAKGRPVLQTCRCTGRIAGLRQLCGGIHVYLWRNPRDQWWSYKTTPYFDASVELVFNASEVPAAFREIKRICGIETFRHEDLYSEVAFAMARPLPAEKSYFAFFALWLYSLMSARRHTDLLIGMDAVSSNDKAKEQMLTQLASLGIKDVDLSGCNIPRTQFNEWDRDFFSGIERQVVELFRGDDFSGEEIEAANEMKTAVTFGLTKGGDTGRDALRARQLVIRQLDEIAHARQQRLDIEDALRCESERRDEAETRVKELADRVDQAEARSGELADRVDQAEARAEQAEARAGELVDRAEARAGELAVSVGQAETKVSQLHIELNAVYSSRSWRITWPLRIVGLLTRSVFSSLRNVLQRLKITIKILLQPLILTAMRVILRRPGIRRRVNAQLYRHPRLRQRLVLIAQNAGLIPLVQPSGHRRGGSASPGTPALRDHKAYHVIQRLTRACIWFFMRHPGLKKKIRAVIRYVPPLEGWLIGMWARWRAAACRTSPKSGPIDVSRTGEEITGVQTSLHPRERSVDEALGIIRAELKRMNG